MSQYLNLLGLAQRAGKISLGEDNILNDIRSNQATLVLIASDASSNTRKSLQINVTVIKYLTVLLGIEKKFRMH